MVEDANTLWHVIEIFTVAEKIVLDFFLFWVGWAGGRVVSFLDPDATGIEKRRVRVQCYNYDTIK
jgi:hypothetical protein